MPVIINSSYLLSCFLLILSIRSLASPKTARLGNFLGIVGMGLVLITALISLKLPNELLTIGIIASGGIIGIWTSFKVKITALPQMIAAFNGLGGLAAACIAISEVLSYSPNRFDNTLSLIIGGLAFAGSAIAFAKLQGIISTGSLRFKGLYFLNFILVVSILGLSIWYLLTPQIPVFLILSGIVLLLGILLVLPIGGADMPVIISLLNSYSGWAAVSIGLSLHNTLLIIIGSIVGASGTILAYIMIKAMNRSLLNIVTGGFTERNKPTTDIASFTKAARAGSPEDAAFIMENASKIIIVPGYGMAAAQAQHALKTMAEILKTKYQADVKFAIHPVAGRMPGHMNVLLAEANIDYTEVYEMADINHEFSSADVAYIIGANDITNPIAKTDPASPLYGMPVLDVEKAKTVFFVKRSLGGGYSGVDNPLFYAPNTIMLYGDAREVTEKIVKTLEE